MYHNGHRPGASAGDTAIVSCQNQERGGKTARSKRRHARQYVQVVCRTEPDGSTTPIRVDWPDGRTFDVEVVGKPLWDVDQQTGLRNFRYKVQAGGRMTYLWRELSWGRWYVIPREGPAGS